jgi:DNA gyrase inhibitor GyrI
MRAKTILILMAAGAGVIGLAVGSDALAKYEEPNYEVLRKSQEIEIRQYPPVIAAEIEVSGTREKAANDAFRILAGYIFGKNISRDKIAMTVPVTEIASPKKIAMTVPVTSVTGEGKMTMRFYMPSHYTLETLPEPVDKRIKFTKLPTARYAVIKFSGLARQDNIARHEVKLRKYLKECDLTPQGEAVRAFYNPPWTLPFMRRNEIWLPLEISDS